MTGKHGPVIIKLLLQQLQYLTHREPHLTSNTFRKKCLLSNQK